MAKSRSVARAEKDKSEHLLGKIRSLDKRLRIAERENARLTKYIQTREYELSGDTDNEAPGRASKGRVCTNGGCGSEEFYVMDIPSKIDIKRFYTCKKCGKREKENVSRPVEAGRK